MALIDDCPHPSIADTVLIDMYKDMMADALGVPKEYLGDSSYRNPYTQWEVGMLRIQHPYPDQIPFDVLNDSYTISTTLKGNNRPVPTRVHVTVDRATSVTIDGLYLDVYVNFHKAGVIAFTIDSMFDVEANGSFLLMTEVRLLGRIQFDALLHNTIKMMALEHPIVAEMVRDHQIAGATDISRTTIYEPSTGSYWSNTNAK